MKLLEKHKEPYEEYLNDPDLCPFEEHSDSEWPVECFDFFNDKELESLIIGARVALKKRKG